MAERRTIALLGPNFAEYRFSEDQSARIRAAAGDAVLDVHADPQSFLAALPHADIAAGHVRGVLPGLGRLAWLHCWSAGMDQEPVAALAKAGVRLTSSKGNGAIPIAEYTLMAMLMLARRATEWIDAQRAHAWTRHVSTELHGATLGLIGVGNIGAEIARRADAFGMRCIATRRGAGAVAHVRRMLPADALPELLAEADFVVVAAPITPETRFMLTERHFRAMKPSAFYVCVSRGAVADPAALHRALAEGWIAGAALDAHATEPLPADSPFWDMPNVLVTPHNAGTTLGTAERSVDIFVDNLGRFGRGEALRNVVDAAVGY